MALPPPHLQFFADFIQRELGIIYARENSFQLEKRLQEIARQIDVPSLEELYKKAQGGISGHFRQLLLDVATNNETSFFRDPKTFEALEKHIIPAIRAQFPKLPVIRIWSAASSFGQEPYSLSISFLETAKKDPTLPRFEIVASDISQTALKRAKEGLYSQLEVQRGLSAPLLIKYFTKSKDDAWTINPEARVCVQFRAQNLLEPMVALGNFELIFCRNVLIYQSEEKKKQIVEQIRQRLVPGGFLVLGAAESLLGISTGFEQICKDGAIYFQKRN